MAALLILTLRTKYHDERIISRRDSGYRAGVLPVQESEQIQNTQARQDMPVNLGHQPALGGGRQHGDPIVR